MDKKSIIVSVVVVFILVATLAYSLNYYINNGPIAPTGTYKPAVQSAGIQTPSPAPNSKVKGYTLADVSKHNSTASCWAVVNKKVYDLTQWISKHPGGPVKIVGICGKDGSDGFNEEHEGAAEPAQDLSIYYIGELN